MSEKAPSQQHAFGPEPPVVAYLTDVEGRWDKLESFVRGNPYVSLDAEGKLHVASGAVFVFGGDALDRGPDARRLVEALLDLKARQPSRAVFIAGNRDINKMRLPRELSGAPPSRTPHDLARLGGAPLLKWIFENTMGARQAFEMRREELARTRADVSDEIVVRSFLEDLEPSGAITRFLGACQLAYRAGNTLFVHGSVTTENLGRVPGLAGRCLDDIDEWTSRLNDWYRAQVGAFAARDHTREGRPGWADLVDYQAPLPGTRLNQSSVVYARPTDDLGDPHLPPAQVIAALLRAGIERVVVGHTPVGDSPAVLRDKGFELIVADNSYGAIESGSKVFIQGPTLQVYGLAQVDDTVREVHAEIDLRDDTSPVGRRDEQTGALIKGMLDDGSYLVFKSLGGWRRRQEALSAREIASRTLVAPR